MLLVALWFFPCVSHADSLWGSGADAEWDDRDVEAADAYRDSERARAERYRAETARRETARRAPRVNGPPSAATRRAAARRAPARPGPHWWDRALADLDEGFALVADGAKTAAEWRAFWSAEVEPRWRSWRSWRAREPDSFAARLVEVMLGEVNVGSSED
jgi:hypothetical protein